MDKTPGKEPTTLGDLSDKTLDKLFQDKSFLKKIEPYTSSTCSSRLFHLDVVILYMVYGIIHVQILLPNTAYSVLINSISTM